MNSSNSEKESAIARLHQAVKTGEMDGIKRAAEAVDRAGGDPGALLISLIADDKLDLSVRQQAARGLCMIDWEAAQNFAERLLRSPQSEPTDKLVQEIKEALAQRGISLKGKEPGQVLRLRRFSLKRSIKRLFRAQRNDSHKSRKVMFQRDSDPPIMINPHSISHAFVVLAHHEWQHADAAANVITILNKTCQPSIWSCSFRPIFVIFTASPSNNGYPDAAAIPPALTEAGLVQDSSIVVNDLSVSFDGGHTKSKVLAGFAYHDSNPRILIPISNGCLPTQGAA